MHINRIAVIGGTGALGSGLAMRFTSAGFAVAIGSRDARRAAEAAAEIADVSGSQIVTGHDNVEAAEAADIVFVAVPFASQADTLRSIAAAVKGKILVDTTVPLVPPKVARVQLPAAGSAAAIAAETLGAEVRLVTGFHNVSAHKLRAGGSVGCDILIFGDDVEARETVIGLVDRIGMRALHGGPLANSIAAEAMTSVLISINKRYKVADGAGVRIIGVGQTADGG